MIEYTGEQISRRKTKRRGVGDITYLFTLDDYWTLDGAVGGSGAEIINHSCDPNLYSWNFKRHILYMSKRVIEKGEELTMDYRFDKKVEKVPCLCGATNCRGTINLLKYVPAAIIRAVPSPKPVLRLRRRHPGCKGDVTSPNASPRACVPTTSRRMSFLASDASVGCHLHSAGHGGRVYCRAISPRGTGASGRIYAPPRPALSVRSPDAEGLNFTLALPKPTARSCDWEAKSRGLRDAAAFMAPLKDAAALSSLTADEVRGKVLLVEMARTPGAGGFQAQRRLMTVAATFEPALIVLMRPSAAPVNPNARVQLRDAGLPAPKVPILTVGDKVIFDTISSAKPGPMEFTVSAHIAAPILQHVKIRNVVGLLRGSDPQLKDTYIIVTGHYDHLGVRRNAPGDSTSGDNIYNGANDDASGTASVIEIANTLSAIGEKRGAKTSLSFGEEIEGSRASIPSPRSSGSPDHRRYQPRTQRGALRQ